MLLARLALSTLVLVAAGPAAAVDLTGTFRAEISTPIVPDGVLPCTFDFTQTGSTLDGTVTCLILPPLPFTGTINPTFGFFSVAGSVPFVCPTLTITGLGAFNSYTFNGFFTCADGIVPIAGSVVGSRCGNGLMDPTETCEDDNWTNGDCCSSTCQLAPNGSACTADANVCTNDVCNATGTCTHPPNTASCDDGLECTSADVCGGGSCHGVSVGSGVACNDGDPCTPDDACDGAGTCVPAGSLECGPCMDCVPLEGCSAAGRVEAGCVRPTTAKALLQMKDSPNDASDQTKWKFAPGGATDVADFGNPTSTTDYTLCVFEQSTGAGYDQALLGVAIPAGTGWTATPTGFKFKSKTDTARVVVMKAGTTGQTKILVKAKGPTLDLPPLPVDLAAPILVQLQSALGTCWQSEHQAAVLNSGTQFKSKTGSPSGAFVTPGPEHLR